MGYYTAYTLNIKKYPENDCNLISEGTRARIDQEVKNLHVFEDGDATCGFTGFAKWYHYEEDMRLLSSRIPDVLFELCGEGESNDDFWKCYFINGKSQFCFGRIVYEEFNPTQLNGAPPKQERYSYE